VSTAISQEAPKHNTGHRWAWLYPAALVAAVAAIVAYRKTGSWDFFWHLQTGRVAFLEWTTLPVDIFSYSYEGQPWLYKDLVADVLLWGTFTSLGFVGVALLKAAAVTTAALGVRAARSKPIALMSPWIAAALYIAAIQNRLVERPLLFSLALLPLVLGLVERVRRRLGEPSWLESARAWLPLVLVQWAWVCLHREAIAGLALLLAFGLYVVLWWLFGLRIPRLRMSSNAPSKQSVLVMLTALLVALLMSVVNPSGLAFFRSTAAVAQDDVFLTSVSDFSALTFSQAIEYFPVTLSLCSIAGLWVIVSSVRRVCGARRFASVTVFDISIFATISTFSMQSVRWFPYLSAVSALIILRLLEEIEERLISTSTKLRLTTLRLVSIIAVVCLVATTNTHEPGLGEQRERYPEGALAFAQDHQLGERVVNSFVFGGYVIWQGWPRFRPLVDGRNDTVYDTAFVSHCVSAQHDQGRFESLLERYNADWVLASNEPGREHYTFLARHPDWWLVYWSEAALVYVRRESYPELEELRFRFIQPDNLVQSLGTAVRMTRGNREQLQTIYGELLRMGSSSPHSIRLNVLMALFFNSMSPEHQEDLDVVLSFLRETAPDHPAVLEVFRRLGREIH
jgi:hypothetical protein